MSKIPYIKLKEFCTVNQGLQIPISKRFKENGINRYFYITVQFLKDNHDEKFYIENPPVSSICEKNDIIVVRTGSTGQILTEIRGCFHNNFFKINYNDKLIFGKYLYYCLTTKEKQKEMKRRAGITTIPDLNHFMFLDIKIPLPGYNTQKNTAKFLDTIRKKIELNNKINEQLENMAKLIYDYWFVQFDFPDYNGKPYKSSGGRMVFNEELNREIPEGWERKFVSEIAIVKAGGDKPDVFSEEKTDNCSTPIFANGTTNGGLYGYTNKAVIDSPSITITARGSIGYTVLRNKPFVPIIRLIVITPKNDKHAYFIYEYIKSIGFDKSGSVQQQLISPMVSNLKILCPNDYIIEEFNKLTNSYTGMMEIIKEQNQKLEELRDWILPMLMNGQVTVKDN